MGYLKDNPSHFMEVIENRVKDEKEQDNKPQASNFKEIEKK